MKRHIQALFIVGIFLSSCGGGAQKEEVSEELKTETKEVEQKTEVLDQGSEELEKQAEQTEQEVDSLLQDI